MCRLTILIIVMLTLVCNASAGPSLLQIPEPIIIQLHGINANLATVQANFSSLKYEEYEDKEISFTLENGTIVGGLYFPKYNSKRLLIGTFGFLTDRWSPPAAQFVNKIVEAGKLDANFLVLDHPTSAPFWINNSNLSVGGYDEGRMILEVAEKMKAQYDFHDIHLLGISMGGNGVINALAEAQRISPGLFTSGMTFSAVTDFSTLPFIHLAYQSESRTGTGNPQSGTLQGFFNSLGVSDMLNHFEKTVQRYDSKNVYEFEDEWIEHFFHLFFNRRIQFLQEHKNEMRADIDFSSLESYLATTSLLTTPLTLRTPLVMIHAEDDPAVPFEHLFRMGLLGRQNPNIVTYLTPDGGHWGFSTVYGADWVAQVIQNTIDYSEATHLKK